MSRKWIILAVCAALPAAIAAEPSLSEITQKLEMLQQQVQAQQAVIEQLRSQLGQQGPAATHEQVSDLVKQEVSTAMEKQAQSESGSSLLKLGSNIDSLTLKGDLRLRYEYRDRDDQGKANRDRMRTRFRLGGVWKASDEGWEIGAGVATGGSDATSTNDTWSDTSFFDTGDIRLDYAYAKHAFTLGGADVEVIAGQQVNPFVSSWVLWDSDVRPAGITLTGDACGFFGTLGWYDVYNAGNEISKMIGAQVGYGFKTEAVYGKVAAAYYSYDDSVWKDSDMNGDGFADYGDSGFGFQIGDLYADIGMPLGKKASVNLYADCFKNFGATGGAGQGFQMDPGLDAGSEDTGWVAGIGLKAGAFSLGYSYAAIAENAVNPYLMDADFGSGLNYTDVEGHRLTAGYKVTKNCSVSVLAQFAEAMQRDDVGGVDLYQLDLSYKF